MKSRLAAAGLLALIAAFTIVPLLVLFARSSGGGWVSVWASPEALWALRNTLLTAAGSAGFAFSVGVPVALVLERTDVPWARAARTMLTLPAAIPPYVWAMGWVALANPRAGLLNLAFGAGTFDIYGVMGIAFVLGGAGLPMVVLPTCAALSRIDSSLEEAARLSGASVWRTLLTVPLPLALPASLSGAALVFLYSASSFGAPYILGVSASPPTPTLTTRMYSEVLMGAEGLHRAAVLSAELLVLAVAVLLANAVLSRSNKAGLSLGKGFSRRPMPLGRTRITITAIIVMIIVVIIILPLLAVFLTSLEPTWGQLKGLGFSHWRAVLSNARTVSATGRSLVLSVCAAVLVTSLGMAIALTRRKWLETVGDAIFALPGTVFALALLVAFSRDVRLVAFERVAFVLALGNTLILLLIAYVAKHLAYGIRSVGDGLAQLDPSLAEAARVGGASRGRAFVDAVVPQLRGPIATALMLTFLTCMTELTVSVLLVPSGSEVLGTLVFELQSYADPGAAAVIACAFVIMVILVMTLTLALNRSRRSLGAR